MSDWSLKGKEIGDIYMCTFDCIDIETLRQKLIEDFKKYDKETHWAYGEFSKGAELIINKRFGVGFYK